MIGAAKMARAAERVARPGAGGVELDVGMRKPLPEGYEFGAEQGQHRLPLV